MQRNVVENGTEKQIESNEIYLRVPFERFKQMLALPVETKTTTVASNSFSYNRWEQVYLMFREHFPNITMEHEFQIQPSMGCIIKTTFYDNVSGLRSEPYFYAVSANPFQGWKGIRDPDAQQIMHSLTRARPKAVAFFCGLGFSTYVKEEEPAWQGDPQQTPYAPQQTQPQQPQQQGQPQPFDWATAAAPQQQPQFPQQQPQFPQPQQPQFPQQPTYPPQQPQFPQQQQPTMQPPPPAGLPPMPNFGGVR